MPALRSPGRSLLGLALILSLVAFVTAALSDTPDGDSDPPPPPANTEDAALMIRVGLGADALTAVGVRGADVASIVAAALAYEAQGPALGSLDASYAQAKTTVDRLRRLVRSGRGSQEDVSTLAQAKTDLENAESARQAHINAMRAAGMAGTSAGVRAAVETIYANQSWRLPTVYLVKDRAQADWVALRDALATKRISENYGEPFDQAAQDTLAGVDAETEIATAKVNLDTYMAAVQTAWNEAVTP